MCTVLLLLNNARMLVVRQKNQTIALLNKHAYQILSKDVFIRRPNCKKLFWIVNNISFI